MLAGACGAGLGACHVAASTSISQAQVDAAGVDFEAAGCATSSCVCDPAPPAACEAGRCVAGPYCEGRDIGEVWLAEDGCNACVCNFMGISCGAEPCPPDDPRPSCGEVEGRYGDLLAGASSCAADADCQVLRGQCEAGLGGCYEAANASVEQRDLGALGALAIEAECAPRSCDCGPAPPSACEGGACGLGRFCGAYDLGERWADEDGCNTCACTLDGPLCTQDVCADACEGAALPLCPDPCRERDEDGAPCVDGGVCGDEVGLRCECVESFWICGQVDPPVEGCARVCAPPPEDACAPIEADYGALIEGARGCDVDSDCAVLFGQCGVGLGGCYEAVNASVEQRDLGRLGAAWFQARCELSACDCDPAPPAVCDGGACGLGRFCEAYDLGERWADEDGCNTCVCTLDGPLCSDKVCSAGCEAIEREYASMIEAASTCAVDADCNILQAHCGVGDCFEYINDTMTQADLDEINGRYVDAGCRDLALCHCLLPFEVSCLDGQCKPEF